MLALSLLGKSNLTEKVVESCKIIFVIFVRGIRSDHIISLDREACFTSICTLKLTSIANLEDSSSVDTNPLLESGSVKIS